ncbi:unnamed protein product [Amoebophrya sp. A120]|nr:unnamed protein product [Amoebophrya sp. A120]|eukprot:GSA120T00023035001.1
MLAYLTEAVGGYMSEFAILLKRPRAFFVQLLNLACIIFTALMLWRGLSLMTGSESPVVVVLSGSMEPGFYRGDILILNMWREERFVPGDVIVFQVEGRGIPIVHRIVNAHKNRKTEEYAILTKGDNNQVDDRGLYMSKQNFISRKEVMGRAFGFLPYVGMITILLNDYPWLKYIMIGSMGFFVMIGRESKGWL